MSEEKIYGALCALTGAALFLLLGCWQHSPTLTMGDFKAVYYASQALVHHQDPYLNANLYRIYSAAPENRDLLMYGPLYAITSCVNLPTTLALMAPLALLPWEAAHNLWFWLIAASILGGAFVMWKEGASTSPKLTGVLLLLFLSGSQALPEVGNAAAIVIGCCIVAAWCFIHRKYPAAGVLCLAISLVLKPQDAGFVWLYFLLAGGTHRRRALQTLGMVAVLAIPSVFWVSQVSPHWVQELHSNFASTSAPRQVNDPAPQNVDPAVPGAIIISLQTVTSFISSEPRIYNLLAYAICAPFILLWAMAVLRARPSPEKDWLGLAAIVPISMLVCYHRQHDTRLLMLVMPACAMLYASQKRSGKTALALVVLTALASSNFILQTFGSLTLHLRASTPGLGGELLNATLGRPVPLAILALGAYLCVLMGRSALVPAPGALASPLDSLEDIGTQEPIGLLSPAPSLRISGD